MPQPPRTRTPGAPTPSAASIAPNIRTPSAICWPSISTSRRCCPSDEAGYGFDNVTVGESLAYAARKLPASGADASAVLRSAVAAKSPGGDIETLPPDLTQEQQFEDLPLGTHGGMIMQYTFPQDAEYDITVRLQRDRNEHVEGIAGSHEVEVMLDGERVSFVTVQRRPAGSDHSGVDKDLSFRLP